MYRTTNTSEFHLLLTGLLLFSIADLPAQMGMPDPSFGTDGLALMDIGAASSSFSDIAQGPDGKVIAVGTVTVSTEPLVRNGLLMRLLPDGTPDPEFGANGVVTTAVFDGDYGYLFGVDVRADGRIVVAGWCLNYSFIARFLPTGEPDPDFGTDGYVNFDELQVRLTPMCISYVSGGSEVLVAGSTYPDGLVEVERFNDSGVLDEGFGLGGITTWGIVDTTDIRALAIGPGGDIYVGGQTYRTTPEVRYGSFVMRFSPEGIPDLGFGDDAVVRINANTTETDHESIGSLVATPDGYLSFEGATNLQAATPNGFLGRLTPTGEPDPDLNAGAIFFHGVGSGGDLIVRPDGSIVVSCVQIGGQGYAITVKRMSWDGSPDVAFGPDGIVTLPTEIGNVDAALLQSDGRIVVAGRIAVGAFNAMAARFRDDLNVGLSPPGSRVFDEVSIQAGSQDATLRFMLHRPERLTATLCDAQGRRVWELFRDQLFTTGLHQEPLRLGELASGPYLITLSNGSTRTSLRFINTT
ncbi:MAG: hypothetical protein JNL43_15840 [Flavobacteriales bacterium]|nr:hypothetical protein [Flavobacteriales bacterium]